MTDETNLIKFDVAHDGGNGYMKDRINGQTTVFPSVLARFLPGMQNNIINFEDYDAIESFLSNYLQNMDVTIKSDGVNSNARYLVGSSATTSGAPLINFNVQSVEGKNRSDISLVSALSLISYHAIKQYYDTYSRLPYSLEVIVPRFATDLPIDEMKNKTVRDSYISRFKDYSHEVTVNNFDSPITITVSFKNVDLQAEGVIGELGLIFSPIIPKSFRGDDIFEPLLTDYNLDHFDGQDLLEVGNVIGIDIGDGTVDFSTMNGASALPNMNDSLNSGIGNIAEDAINALHQDYPTIRRLNRQKFMQIANRGDDEESRTYKKYLDDQAVVLNQQIISKISSLYSRLDQQVGLIVVSGGGAVTLKASLYKVLKEAMNQLDSFHKTKILWVESKYAQTLNLDGLQARVIAMRDDYSDR